MPAPLTPTSPTRSPGPSRQVACASSLRRRARDPRPRGRSRPCRDAAPRTAPARARSRGGGSSAISTFAASMRNLGLAVRAGAPRRSQASSLRARFCRRLSVAAACRGPLRLGQHVGGVAAVVLVDGPVVHLPGAVAHRVEEPAVVGDDDERPHRVRPGAGPASRRPRRRGGWSARPGRAGRDRRAAAVTASTVAARRRRARPRSGPGALRRGGLHHLTRDRVRGPLVVGAPAEHPLADAGRPVEVVGLVQHAQVRARRVASPARCPAASRRQIRSRVVLPSPLRPTTPIRCPWAMPRLTAGQQRTGAVRLARPTRG